MNFRRLLLFALLIVAAWLALFGDKTPPADAVVDVVAAARSGAAAGSAAPAAARKGARSRLPGSAPDSDRAAADPEVLALIPREELIPGAADGRPVRDLFPALSWAPPPPPVAEGVARPMPPMAPPLPFVYLGKKLEDGRWEAYLGHGEQVFIVREGMTLAGTYKVRKIAPQALTLIYLPLKKLQTIPIGGSP
ncbi:hypothetical protein [Accumulibacter sp.]|uniref:hypothetical protein n=1 Tax=Accumulibacter sp. TaxID=2053492 RepID=UPI0025F161AA|nr:hypothetical protein [Accumulibacter sp.]MCP5229669.1 hypothetical protein [Accumulibacter sp.]